MGRLRTVTALVLAAGVLAVPADARQKPGKPPTGEEVIARSLAQAVSSDYENWRLRLPPVVTPLAGGGWQLAVRDASYVVSGDVAIDFASIELRAVPQGDRSVAVSIAFPGDLSLVVGDGVWATLTLGDHSIHGSWEPDRAAFGSLQARIAHPRMVFANGNGVAFEDLEAKFSGSGERAEAAAVGRGLRFHYIDGNNPRLAEDVRAAAVLDALDTAPRLTLDYSHALARVPFSGVMGEVTPVRLGLAATASNFPWQQSLRELAVWVVDVAGRAPTASIPWGGLWSRVSGRLSEARSQVDVARLTARSLGLEATARGKAEFGERGPNGRFDAEIKGINERIAALTSRERREEPMLFPALALMTVVGEGVTEGRQRFHRYRLDVVDGVMKVNGRDALGLKP